MQTSLSARLTYRIMAVVLVMMVVVASVVYYTVRSYMREEANNRYLALLLKNHQEVHRMLLKVSIAIENSVHDVERDIDQPEKMYGHMERILRQNPSIACSYLLFEPGYYPGESREFCPIARRYSADSILVQRLDSLPRRFLIDVWFPAMRKEDQSGWSKVYYESVLFAIGQKPRLLSTYTVPVHDRQGRAVTMLAADLSLEDLRTQIMEDIKEINEKYEQGQEHQSYFFIVDRKGTYVMHPDPERMLKSFDSEVGKMMMKHRGTCVTKVDGVMSRLYYRTIPNTDWTLTIVTPKDVILANAFKLNSIIMLVMLLGLAAVYFLCRHYIRNIAEPVAMQKATLEHELKIANAIQMAMLPHPLSPASSPAASKMPPLASFIDLHASLTPARDVGGDFYDYFLRDNRLFFCIGDVSGKGVPAALLMAVMRSMFRSETRRSETASAIVDTMNRNLSEEYTSGYFVTMFVGILDVTTGHLDYCNAGHEPPIMIHGAVSVVNCARNLPVGALSDWVYESQQMQLLPGDMLFLYTDGLSEAKNVDGKQLGRERIHQLAAEHTVNTARQLITIMETDVRLHADGAEQSDDITLLAIKWKPDTPQPRESGPRQEITMSASMDDIGCLEPFVQQAVEQAGLTEREGKRLRLAVEEAVANIVNHGEATTIALQSVVEDQQLVLTIDDDGQPFDPTGESPTDLSVPADERPPGGLGVMLIHKMVDSLSYERVDGHNILRLIKIVNNNIIIKL